MRITNDIRNKNICLREYKDVFDNNAVINILSY